MACQPPMPIEGTPLPRRRPPERRQLIVDAAARAFSAGGYHAVRLDDIADAVGISTPALYRHFPNKYALFAETTARLAETLHGAVADIESGGSDELESLLGAIATTAIANRRTGGLYRWESRYLDSADAQVVLDVVIGQHRRIRAAVRDRRPALSKADADLIAAAMTSVVASPATHRATMATPEAVALIRGAAVGLLDTDLPAPTATVAAKALGLTPTARREVILGEAIALFAARGFHDVTVEDIATAVGMPPSGVYRHFTGKAAILEACFWRAADRVSAAVNDALAAASTPREAILELVAGYVQLSCRSTELITVYVSEVGHVSRTARTALRNQQRITVAEWATWVARYRPELNATAARFLVHAALNVIADQARRPNPPAPERIAALADRILLGD